MKQDEQAAEGDEFVKKRSIDKVGYIASKNGRQKKQKCARRGGPGEQNFGFTMADLEDDDSESDCIDWSHFYALQHQRQAGPEFHFIGGFLQKEQAVLDARRGHDIAC